MASTLVQQSTKQHWYKKSLTPEHSYITIQ